MEKNQTAVEWLINKTESLISIETFQEWQELKEQAIKIEKEQIIDAHDAAYIAMNLCFRGYDRSVEYYENTYGKE